MHFDVVIIGAGMSGLAAGIRLAYFDKRVCIVEKHYAYGGLNSYYTLGGYEFDVGLHAVTNFVPEGVRNAPLPKLLRQLRLTREDFQLKQQRFSEIRFPGATLRFDNDIELLKKEVARSFPQEAENFSRLIDFINAHDDVALDATPKSARRELAHFVNDPVLIDMILCPLMYYGSAEEHDMDFTQFSTMFKSIFLQGFARPTSGVRTIVKALVRKFRGCGGQLKMHCGVEALETNDERVTKIRLSNGEMLTADVVLSSIGRVETTRLCGQDEMDRSDEVGKVSFVETIAIMDRPPSALGHELAIVFFSENETFCYAVPSDLVDLNSGVICCPSNYEGHGGMEHPMFRVTWLANYERWMALDETEYRQAKDALTETFIRQGERCMPGFRDHVRFTDMFTPRTIEKFTGHINGAVYGAPRKVRDGRTAFKNLFLCGTDQGFLGIIGAMLSGITIANLHVLSES